MLAVDLALAGIIVGSHFITMPLVGVASRREDARWTLSYLPRNGIDHTCPGTASTRSRGRSSTFTAKTPSGFGRSASPSDSPVRRDHPQSQISGAPPPNVQPQRASRPTSLSTLSMK